MSFTEDDLLPLSAIQHLLFCERQCALIHVEQIWEENRLTAEGRRLHEKSDEGIGETRGDLRIARGLYVQSLELGLYGRADVVELRRVAEDRLDGAVIAGMPGRWLLFPVEHKRGRPKPGQCDEAQVCAQAICLEEMLHTEIPCGALFYNQPRRRKEVLFDESLRKVVRAAARRLHEMLAAGASPPAVSDKRCQNCSMKDLCLPGCADGSRSASGFIDRILNQVAGTGSGTR